MRTLILPLLMVFATHTAHALGREVTLDEIMTQHPNQIRWITTCGVWQAKAHGGFYRIVHATLYAQSFLYAQWMETDADGENLPAFTLSLPALNNDHADIQLSRLRCVPTQTGVAVYANAYFAHEEKNGTFEVRLSQEPGQFHFKRRVAPSPQ